jgi:hypothetical protein
VASPGNQAVNGENKPQPAVSGETGLLDSIYQFLSIFDLWAINIIVGMQSLSAPNRAPEVLNNHFNK